MSLALFPTERCNTDVAARLMLSAPAESSNRAPVAAALLGRHRHRLQFDRYIPQRESARPLLLHHADRGLLGAVRHYFVGLVVQAEGERAGPLVAVDVQRDGEPAKSIQDRGTARGGNPGDFTGG